MIARRAPLALVVLASVLLVAKPAMAGLGHTRQGAEVAPVRANFVTSHVFGGKTYVLFLNTGDGAVEIDTADESSGLVVRTPVHRVTWGGGWTHAAFFEIQPKLYLLRHSSGTGHVTIWEMKDGTVGPLVLDELWGRGDGLTLFDSTSKVAVLLAGPGGLEVHTLTAGTDGEAERQSFTSWNDDGKGNAVYLDRHEVRCDAGEALTGFQLRRNPEHTMYRYEYSCRQAGFTGCNTLSTNLDAEGGGKAFYLDRHDVKCPEGNVLTSFKLVRNPANATYGYQYTCCAATLTDKERKSTDMNDDGKGNAVYLDRHNVACPNGKILTGFQLKRNSDHTKYQYEFTCSAASAR